jgi:peptidoglycan L-alanyl-D-glutamate endopeptidase CwlK
MNPHIKTLQSGLGVPADGIRGPVTTTAILVAADEGRLSVIEAPKPITNPASGDDIPAAGDARLVGVHPVLAELIRAASLLCDVPFTVIEGLRSAERQRELVAKGASKTLNSRHLSGHAVDLWPLDAAGKPLPSGSKAAEDRLWADLRLIAAAVKVEAKRRGVLIEWGGDWGWDAPHFQLNRAAYP